MAEIRNDWTRDEIAEIYNGPIMELMYKASVVHHEMQATGEVQVCTLLSVKTGVCPDCPQAANLKTSPNGTE